MKRRHYLGSVGVFATIGSSLFSRTVQAQSRPHPEIVSEFGAPSDSFGLGYDGENLWVGSTGSGAQNLTEISTDGTIQNRYTIEHDGNALSFPGVTALDNNIYLSAFDNESRYLCEVNKDGELLRITDTGRDDSLIYGGLASDEEQLYLGPYLGPYSNDNLIEVYNQNLNLKRTIPIKGNDVRGLAYNDESLWITINDTERDPVHYILQISTDGEELRELSFPNEWGSGMAHDGENLYLINNDNNGIYKLDTDIEYPKPTAAFDINTNEPGETAVVGEEVTFDASDSSHPMNAITTYEWDFTGDGTIDVEESSPRVQYSYDESGEYPVTLHLSDEYDNEVTKTNEVQITEQRDDSDQTSSSSQGTSDEGALDDSVPGFGITGTITGLGSISYMLKQQLPDDD